VLRDVGLIFLGLRVLLFAFFLALSVGKPASHQALVVIPSVLYLILAMYVFLYPGRLKLFKNYGDLAFLPLLVLLLGQKEAILALFAPVALYTSRRVFEGILFLWLLVGFGFYYYGAWGFALLPALFALFIASMHPDLVEALKKERFYIKNLRRSYSRLTREYARLEASSQSAGGAGILLDQLMNSNNLHEYLTNIKEKFELKTISITPLQANLFREPLIDRTNCCLHVPVKLEKGEVNVSFYFSNPLHLYDKELLKTLERAGKLINLYIEGLEERPQTKVIAV
jgi:hypothetical protein